VAGNVEHLGSNSTPAPQNAQQEENGMPGAISNTTMDTQPTKSTATSPGTAANNEITPEKEILSGACKLGTGIEGLSQEELEEMLLDPDAEEEEEE
jgi:hypothetical protein